MSDVSEMVQKLTPMLTEAWGQIASGRKHDGCIILIPVPDLGYERATWNAIAAEISQHRLVEEAVYGSPMRKVMTKAERVKFGGYHTGFVFRCKPFDQVPTADAADG
jgi:hypothetical protein